MIEKLFSKKNLKWIMFGCACFIAVYAIFSLINHFDALTSIPSFIWSLVCCGVLMYGCAFDKENFVKCGILLFVGTFIGAFTNAFYSFTNVSDAFKYEYVWYGLQMLATGFVSLGLATLFVMWLLKTFFNVNISNKVFEIVAYVMVALIFVAFVFTFVANFVYEMEFPLVMFLSPIQTLAYVGIYAGYYYSK